MKIKIGWLFPDTFYLHGERGNILALTHLCKKLGIEAEVHKIDFDTEDFTPSEYDMLFCPPGEISSFPAVIDYLKSYTTALTAFIRADQPLLVTGTSIALWGKEIVRTDGSVIKGLGIIDIICTENEAVYGDDTYFQTHFGGEDLEIVGSQIQMMDIHLEQEEPFGQVLYGYGNDKFHNGEGILDDNAVFTNALGPVLATNPWLTLAFLRIIAENQGESIDASSLDFSLERASFDAKKEFTLKKESNLEKIV